MTNESLLIIAAIFMLAFGAFVTLMESIRHRPATPVTTFIGIAGVYLGLCGTVERDRWLYVPCAILLLAAAVPQLRTFRR